MEISQIRVTPSNHHKKNLSEDDMEKKLVLLDENYDVIRFFEEHINNCVDNVGDEYCNLLNNLGIPSHSEYGWFSFEAIQPKNIMFFVEYMNGFEKSKLFREVGEVTKKIKSNGENNHNIIYVTDVLDHYLK